jgi:hypothetical protein
MTTYWSQVWGVPVEWDPYDGRPRIDADDDRLLQRLIRVHGEPRHDLPRELGGQIHKTPNR